MSFFHSVATGSAAISTTIDPQREFQLEEVRLHLSGAGGAANLTITVDSVSGAAYDVVLATQDMTAVTDYVYQPDRPHRFRNGDKIVIAWANGAGRTYGLEVVTS